MLISGIIVAATICAYNSVFFNFFAGDDYAYLPWLKSVIQKPELFWRNFYSPWMSCEGQSTTLTQFYRPLTTAIMVGEYLLWGNNGLGFRLTNFFCHLVTSALLGLITFELVCTKKAVDSQSKNALTYALSAAALFALYPVHPETVVWIIGRVDGMVTMFSLAGFWCYMRYRSTTERRYFLLSLSSFVLALLCKEMAIALPATLFAYELILVQQSNKSGFFAAIKESIKKTASFWLILFFYFIGRKLTLGTFVGGYDNSLSLSNLSFQIQGWIHGLRMLAVPLNAKLLGAHSALTKCWEVFFVGSALATAWVFMKDTRSRRTLIFLVIWFGLSLLPVYKLFNIWDDLRGSRWAYLASAPLCAFIVYGLAVIGKNRLTERLAQMCLCILVILAGSILFINNQAWAKAGHEAVEIVRAINKFYQSTPGDPVVAVIGLPDEIDGAYVCLNAIDGMTKTPQISRDIFNFSPINLSDPFQSFGILKNSIWEGRNKIKIIRWDEVNRDFVTLNLPNTNTGNDRTWQKHELKTILQSGSTESASFNWLQDGSLKVAGLPLQKKRPFVDISLTGINCWLCDYVVIGVHNLKPNSTNAEQALLLYKNDLVKDFKLESRAICQIKPDSADQELIFPLHGLATWAMGGTNSELRLSLPPGSDLVIEKISISSGDALQPKIGFSGSFQFGKRNVLHIDEKHPSTEINFDVSKIPSANNAWLEISPSSVFFQDQNASIPICRMDRTIPLSGQTGAYKLTKKDFKTNGLFAVRLRALDKKGNFLGVASDQVIISAD